MVVISELLEQSSSSSTTHGHHIYDVFFSFRGIDTRLNFTDHLHQALVGANIATFLDDEEIETGASLKPELETAIKASRASIIVLSENYASSTWCLDELVLILDQMRTSGHIVIPIFYHVEPTDVRKQQSSFGIAMEKHEQRMEAETNVEEKVKLGEKMDKWKKTLVQVANLKGKDAKGRKETEFIEEIVKDIYHQLGVPLRSSTLPLLYGMEYDIQFITSWLTDGSSHTADVLTICGLGGIGKTTLARYVYESHCRLFDRSSFIEGVNENCTQLVDLQKQLSHDISKKSSIPIPDDRFRRTSIIEDSLARQKVFIVLDDIGSVEQLDTLLGKKVFHPGSKIIITTKDSSSLYEKYTLINSVVQPKHTKIFLRGLGVTASLQLLSFHAFKGNRPEKGYEEVSEKLTEYCQGHPLALKVLGESLHKRDVTEWEERVEGLTEETDSRIQKVLQMSFDSMPSNNDKELFKHIACFFVGKDRNYTETILKACGIRTLHGITNLIDRCFLTIGPRNELKMHQLLQEMGRDVVRQESPNKPWKRSRLCCHKESFSVFEQNKGSGKVEGLVLDMKMLEKEEICESFELKNDALSKMVNLMLLQLNHVKFNGSCKNFPRKIRWLCMHGFPSKSLPSDLPMENIVALDMSYSNLESFGMSYGYPQQQPGKTQNLSGSCSKRKKLLGSLKILNLSFCKQLRSLGGFSEFRALEKLILANCTSLAEVCESIEQCDELDLVDLSYCNEIGKSLRTIVKLKKVKTLKLEGCRNLGELQIETRDPKMLKANNISMDSQTSSSAIVEAIPRVVKSYLVYLPSSLVSLSLRGCFLSNESFPKDMSSLSMLKELCLDGNDIVSMPNCVRTLSTLENLCIDRCYRLTTIEHPPPTLKNLTFDFYRNEGKVLFEREMSALQLQFYAWSNDLSLVEGVSKLEDMGDVEEEVLRSLGWSNLDFTKCQPVGTESKIKMLYEFGIFSTCYVGNKMPNWISHKSEWLSSISFTIPSSRNNLRGLNLCFVLDVSRTILRGFIDVKISNETKKCTWIYHCPTHLKYTRESITFTWLSHWMFGKNEMEDGDQITISILNEYDDDDIRECGVSFVYDEDDDGKKKMEEEEDVLGYYKSWNHIIGGDLSPFQTTTPGEYDLSRVYLLGLVVWRTFRAFRPGT